MMIRWLPKNALLILMGLAGVCLMRSNASADDSAVAVRSGNGGLEVKRSSDLKTLNGHFPFVVPESHQAWESRAAELRQRVQIAVGLWPMPKRAPITPLIYDRVPRDGFTIEKVAFESLPGHWVSGLLFRPAPDNSRGVMDGRRPAVLSPHGHGGRNYRANDKKIAAEIASGAEKYDRSGRSPKLARCAHLARMGCVTFIFDMLGYADSQQISYEVAHRHHQTRPEESNREQPCFYSIDADLNLQSIMGLQTFNAIRSLDFLESLDDVDPDRIGVTGGSGGGTQTILLGALDDRVKVSFPNGMVSTSMQGGCFCENCNYLRVGAGNVELAALFAPSPQAMTAADDWTREMMTDGYPQLKDLYGLYGVPENVFCRPLLQFKHNYNYVSRATMYPWMAKHLELGDDTPVIETDFDPFTEQELTVWDDDNPAPKNTGMSHERELLAWWHAESESGLLACRQALMDSTRTSPDANHDYDEMIGLAWRTFFGAQVHPRSDADSPALPSSGSSGAGSTDVGLPSSSVPTSASVVLIALTSDDDLTPAEIRRRAESLTNVGDRNVIPVWIEPTLDSRQALIEDDRPYSGFTFGYNRTLAARRAQSLLAAILHHQGQTIELVADRDAAVAAAGAGFVAGEKLDQLTIRLDGFRLREVDNIRHPDFIPGASKYGDLPGCLALRAPHRLTILGEDPKNWKITQAAYTCGGDDTALKIAPSSK